MHSTIEQFLADPDAWEAYVHGPAGTGKTTMVRSIVEDYTGSKCIVVAHTHKAKGVLIDKLPEGTDVRTLHSFLTKRPTVNEHAKDVRHITNSKVQGKADDCTLLIIDEFSIVGDADARDIAARQDPDYTGKCAMKVIYIGDPYQLPPIQDKQTIVPNGKYIVKLTKVWRTDSQPLINTLSTIVKYIDSPKLAKPLEDHEALIRDCNLVDKYNELTGDKVILAYTNRTVQMYNAEIAGRDLPIEGDKLFSSSLQNFYTLAQRVPTTSEISVRGTVLGLNTKYKTLEHLHTMKFIEYYELEDEDNELTVLAVIFGQYNYKLTKQRLELAAVNSNKAIEKKYNMPAKLWALSNKHDPLARARAKAWRDFLCFNDCVMCIDFPFALTVHKSQGSTYDYVLVDTDDLALCAKTDFKLYLRLTYVAFSRASKKVYTT